MKSDSHPTSGDPRLIQIIREEIRTHGPITFARFMQLAAYHPLHGYYASGRARIGRRGDFFTNVSVGPVFGKLLAAQFAEIWQKLGCPRAFTIVEQGAHDGQFAADVLSALETSECFLAINYVIIEPFGVWRERQSETLRAFQLKTSWLESVDQLEAFTGIHFSNELFDALPVHLVTGENDEWKELFVALHGEEFAFEHGTSSEVLSRAMVVNRPYSTEINLAAPKLIRDISARLARGIILTIDYGFTREEFYSAERNAGTLQFRAQHKKLSSPFEQIGWADISAHVEWTSLIEAAESAGAELIGLTDQHHFLTSILSELFRPDESEKFAAADKRALQTLLHPEILGRNFQALALGKNFGGAVSGFRFARNSWRSGSL